MQGQDPKDHNAVKMNRRKFLTRTGAGLVIASIPARSVWASSGGITQSIVASGHGSDFANGNPIKLLTVEDLQAMPANSPQNYRFRLIFGERPIDVNDNPRFRAVLKNDNFAGPSEINRLLIAIYLSAEGSFNNGDDPFSHPYYPIVGPGRSFPTLAAFATYLYDNAKNNLSDTLDAINKLYNPQS